MSDNYGPQQGWQDQPPHGQPPQGRPQQGPSQQGPSQQWQGQPQQGWPQPQGEWQGQPQQKQPQWQDQPAQQWQGQPAQQWQGQPTPGWQGQQGPAGWQPGQQPPKKKRLGVIVTAVVVVLAIAAGVTVWLVSQKDTQTADGGQASPQAAANDMLLSLADKDVVGVAQQLDPSEAQVFSDMSGDVLGELKRLEIVKSDATAGALTGTTVKVENLTFDDAAAEQINDHVTIVKLTGGTVTLTSDPSKLPLTDKVKEATSKAMAAAQPKNTTVDIAKKVKENGEPFRIATVKRGDKWYPSFFYTAADNWYTAAAKKDKSLAAPELAKVITPVGAGSAEQAVTAMLDKAMAGDLEGVIGMLPPDEMGVLYDYGKRMIAAGHIDANVAAASGLKVSDPQFTTSEVTGGTKVSLKSITVQTQGQKIGITIDGQTLIVDVNGRQQKLTADTVLQMIPGGANMPPQAKDIVQRMFKQALTLGVVTTEVDGKFYVSPLRTYSGVVLTLLQGLQPADIDFFISLAKRNG